MVSSQPFAADSMSLLHSAAENMRAVSPDAACPSSRSAIRRAVVRGTKFSPTDSEGPLPRAAH